MKMRRVLHGYFGAEGREMSTNTEQTNKTYTVSKRTTLISVYNVNKGYADFKQINILYQNDSIPS